MLRKIIGADTEILYLETCDAKNQPIIADIGRTPAQF